MTAALTIFILTYLLISFQNIPGVHIHRPAAALLGATAMVVFGVLPLSESYQLVDLDTLVFILGMMIVSGYLEISGFFEQIELIVLRNARSPRQLLALLTASSGLLSALFMNDTICLMLTPVVLRVTRKARLRPNPYLIALATSANIGSVVTPVGNPQNMIVAIHSGISFGAFVRALLPLGLAGLLLNYWFLCRLYPEDFNSERKIVLDLNPQTPVRSRLLYACMGATALLLILFAWDVHPPLAALAVASLLILLGAAKPRDAFRHVDWELLLMFAGLFVVMGGLRQSGALTLVSEALTRLSAGGLGVRMSVAAFCSVIVSNVVSNVPGVIFLAHILPGLGKEDSLWLLLAMTSTLAGNLTLIGSVANLIVVETAKDQARVGFWEYCRAATLPSAFLIIAGSFYLYLLR
ncbi:MAG: anion transporter [Elusimicrobia bacterium]|nr:anion transporter [Elusimicrobiota bacterium]